MHNKNSIVGTMLIMALFLGIATVSMTQGQTEISLTLSPLTASNPVGTTHTVIATATHNGVPLVGKLVVFSIFSGPNSPFNGTGMTDTSGQATFTYTDTGGEGIDKIQAMLTINEGGSDETIVSNIVKKEWVFITDGFMTGEGNMFVKDDTNVASTAILSSLPFQRVTYRFKLHCDKTKGSNILEVNFGNGNRFHLEELESAKCYFDPTSDTYPPKAGFNTYEGSGTGMWIGHDQSDIPDDTDNTVLWGATLRLDVEPGKKDIASIVIKDKNGITLLEMSGEGHHQVHKDNGIV